MTLSVPLPKKTRLFVVHMFWRDPSIEPRMIQLSLPADANLELLKACLGRKIFLHMNTVCVVTKFSNRNVMVCASMDFQINLFNFFALKDSHLITTNYMQNNNNNSCLLLSYLYIGQHLFNIKTGIEIF